MPPETASPAGTASTDRRTTPARRGAASLWTFRVAVSAHAAALLLQAASAGGLLEGDSAMRSLHGTGAFAVHSAGLVQLVAAVLVGWRCRGPWWPTLLSLLLLVGGVVQSALGGSGAVAIHVPLGASLIALTVWLVVWSVTHRPGSRSR